MISIKINASFGLLSLLLTCVKEAVNTDSNIWGSTLLTTGLYTKLRNQNKIDSGQVWRLEKSCQDGAYIKSMGSRGYHRSTTSIGSWSTMSADNTLLKLNIKYSESGYYLLGKNANCDAGCVDFDKGTTFKFRKVK